MIRVYAELHALSNFSFLRGASHPEELVDQAKRLGYSALALTDHDELGGLAEAQARAAELGLRFVNGVEISVTWEGITIHMVASLDGFVARKDGRVDWMETKDEFADGETLDAASIAAWLASASRSRWRCWWRWKVFLEPP